MTMDASTASMNATPDGNAFDVRFVVGKGRATLLKGRGQIALDRDGVRLVGPRARVDAAFYGACGIALGGAVVAIAIILTGGLAVRPVVIGAALCVLALLNVAHAILIRALPFRMEDRRVPFATDPRVEADEEVAWLVTSERGFMGSTWFVFEGGPSERARFIDEYETARRGGASGYR